MPSAIAARAGPRGSMTDDTGADHRRGHEWLFTLRRPFAHGLRCRPGSVQGRVGTTRARASARFRRAYELRYEDGRGRFARPGETGAEYQPRAVEGPPRSDGPPERAT